MFRFKIKYLVVSTVITHYADLLNTFIIKDMYFKLTLDQYYILLFEFKIFFFFYRHKSWWTRFFMYIFVLVDRKRWRALLSSIIYRWIGRCRVFFMYVCICVFAVVISACCYLKDNFLWNRIISFEWLQCRAPYTIYTVWYFVAWFQLESMAFLCINST